MKMPELSNLELSIPLSPVPLWNRLDESSRYALETAYRRVTDYHKRLVPPGQKLAIAPFDAAREMSQRPESSEYLKETK